MTTLHTKSTASLLRAAELMFKSMSNTISQPFESFDKPFSKDGLTLRSTFGIKASLFVPIVTELIGRGLPIDKDVMAMYDAIREEQNAC